MEYYYQQINIIKNLKINKKNSNLRERSNGKETLIKT